MTSNIYYRALSFFCLCVDVIKENGLEERSRASCIAVEWIHKLRSFIVDINSAPHFLPTFLAFHRQRLSFAIDCRGGKRE